MRSGFGIFLAGAVFLTDGSPAMAQQAPQAVTTVLGQPLYDREQSALVVPYVGQPPAYRLRWRSPSEAELAFPGSTLRPPIARRSKLDGAPLLAGWASLPETAQSPPRIILNLVGVTDVRVFQDPSRGRLLLMPEPIPEGRAPDVPPEMDAASQSVLEVSVHNMVWSENYAAGDSDTQISGVPAISAVLSLPALGVEEGGWALEARLRAMSLSFQDRLLPLSLHHRQQIQSEVWGAWRLGGPDWRARLGGGLLGVFTQGTHSGAPPIPSYNFFSGRQVFGPLLGALGVQTMNGWLSGWRTTGEVSWSPVLVSRLDDGLAPLPFLAYAALEGGLEREWPPLRVRVGYRFQVLYGPAFNEVMMGPSVTLGGL